MTPSLTHDEVTSIVRGVVLSVMGSDSEVSNDDTLLDVGLDSLGATELAGRLSKDLGIKVLSTLVFSYPTINEIIAHVEEKLRESDGRGKSSKLGKKSKKASRRRSSRRRDTDSSRDNSLSDDIAIVGLSCRLPGDVDSLGAMWSMLYDKQDMTSEVSLSRWDADGIIAKLYDVDGIDPDVVDRMRYGGFISSETLNSFDGTMFGISDLEADHMDQGQRLLLTVCYQACQDAGHTFETLKGKRAGVFVGASAGATGEVVSKGSGVSVFDATGSSFSVAAGRISYALGLQGPCSITDTACSSTLVALHHARRSLQLSECDMAVVAGVNILTQEVSTSFAVAGMISADGKCHTFDEAANGYARGEGCGAVILKRLSDAKRDGDSIYATLKGSAVLQDGRSASLTAPNGRAQEQLLQAALSDAGLHPHDVRYIEAHGTGTKLGDPVETEALASVYGTERSTENPLYVGSVKANIGHLEAAAGMTGLFSAILALQHECAPPNCQLKVLNEKIQATVSGLPILFPTAPTSLARTGDRPLIAGISSFGFSGTIAHVIIEQAPSTHARPAMIYTAPDSVQRCSDDDPYKLYTHRMLQTSYIDPVLRKSTYEARLHPGILRDWLADHVLHSKIVMPGVGLLELAAAAGLDYHTSSMTNAVSTTLASLKSSSALIVVEGFTITRPTVVNDSRTRSSGLHSSCLWCTVDEDGFVDIYNEDDDHSRVLCAEGQVSIYNESRIRTVEDHSSSSHIHKHEPDWASLERDVETAREHCVL